MMRPAFSSTKSAAAFAFLLLLSLLSPVLVGKNLLPPREQAYAVQGWDNGAYPWIRNQIFVETNDIDIAFIGSSLMAWGIDTPYVQKKLSEELGRSAVVRTIAWGGTGYDALYFIAQDLLEHRRVHMLVFYDENNWAKGYRNTQTPLWFRFGDNAEALQGLPLEEKGLFYFASIIGLPRNLLGTISPTIPLSMISTVPNYMEIAYKTPNPATRLGSVSCKTECSIDEEFAPFVPFVPQNRAAASDVCLYSEANKGSFHFGSQPLPLWQGHFAKKFAQMAEVQGCRLVLLHIPQLNEMHSPVISERRFWPDELSAKVIMLGIPPNKLFGGMADDEVYWLYANSGRSGVAHNSHLNQNGQRYFTSLITPALLNLYETSTNN